VSTPGVPVSRWTTPRRLRAYVAAAWVAVALLLAVALRAIADDREALRAVRQDTAPSIVAAQELGVHLAGLDTQLTASMLGAGSDRDIAGELFELERSVVTRRLVDAANNITLGDAERIPIVVMQEELGRYLELASRAQFLYAGSDREGAIALLRVATDLMHDRILPQAGVLDRVNREDMDRRYDRAQSDSRQHDLEALVTGGLLVAVLLAAQGIVRARMRRRIVPALLAATLVAAGFTWTLVTRFRDAREDLRVARDDAFNSIHLLLRARALAYDARGDEGRYLLDRPRAGTYESAFRVKTTQLSSNPGQVGDSGGSHGLLVDELHNITFTGERDAAQAALAGLSEVLDVDERIRRLETQGQHAQAVDLAIGTGGAQARAVFDHLDAALQRTAAINRDAFDAVLLVADRGLRRAEWMDPALALGLALAVWLGIRPRLREYAV
jgi:hypothetical protein